MAADRRKRDLLSSRRRVKDEGEGDEDAEDLVDDSQSEASILTVDEIGPADESDLSEISRSEAGLLGKTEDQTPAIKDPSGQTQPTAPQLNGTHSTPQGLFTQTADVEAMVNGLAINDIGADDEVLVFDETTEAPQASAVAKASVVTPTAPAGAQKERPVKAQRRTGPYMQPTPITTGTRTGYAGQSSAPAQTSRYPAHSNAAIPTQPAPDGMHRSRPQSVLANGFQQRSLPPRAPGSTMRWSHDLHDTIQAAPLQQAPRATVPPPAPVSVQTAIPKPSMSKTITLGTVAARIYLQNMEQPRILESKIAIRQHTRLPDLRPPLRRDKAVRISLPNHRERWAFPTPERSFIFIPRAQRPNQQAKLRRGYGSRGGSRRTSVQGSVYSPSVPMSRRSSFMGTGVMSPGGSMMGRQMPALPLGASRPIVRMPPGQQSFMPFQAGAGAHEITYPLPSEPARREHRSSQMTMHQPRPQKQMSVASIEGEQQQAFHQQLPPEARAPSSATRYPSQSNISTPLPHIPEGAINAPSFQPINGPSQPYYYPMQPMYYYPTPDQQHPSYGYPPMGSPYIQPAPYYMPMLLPMQGQGDGDPNIYMQETNGMFYYYDQAQIPGDQPPPPSQLMTPSAEAFYPQHSPGYYGQQEGGGQ